MASQEAWENIDKAFKIFLWGQLGNLSLGGIGVAIVTAKQVCDKTTGICTTQPNWNMATKVVPIVLALSIVCLGIRAVYCLATDS